MKKLMPLFAILTALAFGCARDQLARGSGGVRLARGQGDLGAFILHESVQYGCAPIRTNALPAVTGAWYYLESDSGVQKALLIVMSKDRFPAVVTFLRSAFGNPYIEPEDMGGGVKYGEYAFARPLGEPRIEFRYNPERTQVTIVGRFKKSEDLR
jgi:hypothetical protein